MQHFGVFTTYLDSYGILTHFLYAFVKSIEKQELCTASKWWRMHIPRCDTSGDITYGNNKEDKIGHVVLQVGIISTRSKSSIVWKSVILKYSVQMQLD